MSFGKWRPFYRGLNVLTTSTISWQCYDIAWKCQNIGSNLSHYYVFEAPHRKQNTFVACRVETTSAVMQLAIRCMGSMKDID